MCIRDSIRAEPRGFRNEIRVTEFHDAVDLERIHVDGNHVARIGIRQPAEPQDAEILDNLFHWHAKVACDVVDRNLAPIPQIGHQCKHPGDLIRGDRHAAPSAESTDRSFATTCSLTSPGAIATASGPNDAISEANCHGDAYATVISSHWSSTRLVVSDCLRRS